MGRFSIPHMAGRITPSMMLRILLPVAILCIAPSAALPSQPVIIGSEERTQNITPCLDIFEDGGGLMTIADVAGGSPPWSSPGDQSINRGFTGSAFWFRFQLHNTADRTVTRFIEIDRSNLDYIDFYNPRKDGTFDGRKTGDMRHFSTRDVPDRNFIFTVEAVPGTSTLYFRVKTDSTLRFQLFATTPQLHLRHTTTSLALLWAFFGMMMLLIIYNFTILVFTRNRSYLLFVLFATSVFFYLLVLRGLAFQYLWPGAMKWNSMAIPFFLGLMCVTGTLFIQDQVETRRNFPFIHKALTFAGFLSGASGIALSFLAKVSIANSVSYPLVAALALIMLMTMIAGVAKRNRYALFLLTGFLFLILLVPVNIALTFGILPMNTVTEYSLDFSILWLVVFSSLGLADRINLMRKELQASREQLQLAIDGSNDGIWDYAPGSGRIFLSDRCFTMLGYDPGDFPHTMDSVISLIHPDDRKNFVTTFDPGSANPDEHLTAEFRMHAKEGGWRWIVARGKTVLENGTGKARRITGTNTDVTEARETLEALKKSEEKFYKLFKNSPNIVSVNTVPDLIYQDANDRFFELLGYSRDEVIGHSIQELKIATPEHIEAMGAILLAQGYLKNQEVPFATRGGEKRLGLLTVDTIKIGDKPHFFIIMNDITESREIERELMNIVSDERRRIGQDLHDDLGQTLTGVTFLVQTLRQELKGFPGAAEKTIGKIGDLVMNAIMKVRTISKMLSPVEMESQGFITAIEEMVGNIQEVFLISCEVLYEDEVEIRDNTTAVNLYYIAREAVNNAIKHGKADEIVIRFAVNGGALVMSITDNGAGMDMTRPAGGIGLKAIDYRARIIGATARIYGLESRGTCVSITLPL